MKRLRDAVSRQGVGPRVAESPKTAFWALWTSACALGWVVGGAMSSNALIAIVGWGVAGLLQWGVIARALPRMRAWTVLTAVGGAIGVGTFAAVELLMQRYDPPVLWQAMRAGGAEVGLPSGPGPPSGPDFALWEWPVAGGVVGVAVGSAQGLLLRKRIGRAGHWIPTDR